jgi:hypothetical protein
VERFALAQISFGDRDDVGAEPMRPSVKKPVVKPKVQMALKPLKKVTKKAGV